MAVMKTEYYKVGRITALVLMVWVCVFAGSWGFGGVGRGAEDVKFPPGYQNPDEEVTKKYIAAVIPCKGLIDDGLYQSIRRRTNEALAMGATHLIYEIDTPGGLVSAADDISEYFLLEVGNEAHTVAYVRKALSAGAFISVSCKDIIMLEIGIIGDCAPIALGGELEGVPREKIESYLRAAFRSAAERNNYPEALLEAMVSRQLEVYGIRNRQTGEDEYFDAERMPKDPNKYDLENKVLVVKGDQLCTLTASEAQKYKVARALVKDVEGVKAFLARRDGIEFETETIFFETNWSEELVRLINHPAAMGVLVMLAMLGVYMELNTPGLGLPGLLAVICIVIIVGSKYLVGMANWVEIAIFVVGLILLVVEIFVIPGFGIAGFAGIVFIFAGLFGMLIKNPPDSLPWPRPEFGGWESFTNGLVGISFGFIGFLILAWLFAKYLPKMHFLSGLMLAPAAKGGQRKVSMTAAAAVGAQVNAGDEGVVVSPLRPAGTADFGGIVVDVIDEAQFLEKGVKVEIIEIHGNRVLVREIDK